MVRQYPDQPEDKQTFDTGLLPKSTGNISAYHSLYYWSSDATFLCSDNIQNMSVYTLFPHQHLKKHQDAATIHSTPTTCAVNEYKPV